MAVSVNSVINTPFEDANYVNTVESKVVIKPLGEVMELSVRQDQLLQRTTLIPTAEQDPSIQDVTGDLPPGEIPGSQEAEVLENFPAGKRSRTEAKEEAQDVEWMMMKNNKKKFHKTSQRRM